MAIKYIFSVELSSTYIGNYSSLNTFSARKYFCLRVSFYFLCPYIFLSLIFMSLIIMTVLALSLSLSYTPSCVSLSFLYINDFLFSGRSERQLNGNFQVKKTFKFEEKKKRLIAEYLNVYNERYFDFF